MKGRNYGDLHFLYMYMYLNNTVGLPKWTIVLYKCQPFDFDLPMIKF